MFFFCSCLCVWLWWFLAFRFRWRPGLVRRLRGGQGRAQPAAAASAGGLRAGGALCHAATRVSPVGSAHVTGQQRRRCQPLLVIKQVVSKYVQKQH